MTEGTTPCIAAEGLGSDHPGGGPIGTGVQMEKTIFHDPPLVFDVDADPAESSPLDPSTIPDAMATIKDEYAKFWASVTGTLSHITDYSQAAWARPCGNASSAVCRVNSHPAALK